MVYIYCVNDGAVMTAWKKHMGLAGSDMIEFLADTDASLTDALGLVLTGDGKPYGAKEGEAPLQVARSLLRHRKVHTKAIFGITDDKKHDSFAAQWFMKATLNILQTKYVDTGLSHLVSKPGCCVAQLRCSGAPAKL